MSQKLTLNRVVILVVSGLISILLVYLGYKISRSGINYDSLVKKGYLGVFLSTLIFSSTIFFPAPNIGVIIAGTFSLNPLWVGVIGGAGWGLGEVTGYILGYFLKKFYSHSMIRSFVKCLVRFLTLLHLEFLLRPLRSLLRLLKRIKNSILSNPEKIEKIDKYLKRIEKKGTIIIFAGALIPNAGFDAIGIAAGALRVRFYVFLLYCISGKIISATIIAYFVHMILYI